jgi:hypothetical protein
MTTYSRSIKRGAAAGMVAVGLLSLVTTISPAAATSSRAAAATSSRAAAAPVEAAKGDVKITVLGTNAPGVDTRANRNREYVWIKNVSAKDVNVFGWKLRDGYGTRFTFRPNKVKELEYLPAVAATETLPARVDTLVLPAGHSVIVYTGSGKDVSPGNADHSVYLDLSGHYLNNSSGERVEIKNKAGESMDAISYDAYGINPTP